MGLDEIEILCIERKVLKEVEILIFGTDIFSALPLKKIVKFENFKL